MSRIAGFHQNSHNPEAMRAEWHRQLDRLWPAPQRSARKAFLLQAGGGVGWIGSKAVNAASGQGWLVAMDGRLFNRAEFPDGENDAERFMKAAQKSGFESAIKRLNGDFAIAAYNVVSDCLWLARDRFGLKPLYYSHAGRSVLFASNPAFLLSHPDVKHDLDESWVTRFAGSHYRTFDNAYGQTPYAHIRQVPAAHYLKYNEGELRWIPYWKLEESEELGGSWSDLADRYRELLADAVRLRYRTATNPAFTLSGGMDSSSVLATAVRQTGHKQAAYSTVYVDRTFDEREDIATVLQDCVSDWRSVEIDEPNMAVELENMVSTHGEPVATATWLSHYRLCEIAARDGFGALFGGLGGDELNAGEYEHFLFHFADLRKQKQDTRLAKEIELWVRYHDHPIYRKDARTVEEFLVRCVDLSRPGCCLPDRKRMYRYLEALSPVHKDLLVHFEPEMDRPFNSYLKNRTYQDIFRETLPCCLRAEDRQTAAFGLENYLPFLDHRVVEFMFRIPGDLKFRNGISKFLLREAMRGVLPESTRTRIKKTGWNAPAHQWFIGAGAKLLQALIHSPEFRAARYYDKRVLKKLIDEHVRIIGNEELKDNHMMFFWQLLNLEIWLRWLERQSKEQKTWRYREAEYASAVSYR